MYVTTFRTLCLFITHLLVSMFYFAKHVCLCMKQIGIKPNWHLHYCYLFSVKYYSLPYTRTLIGICNNDENIIAKS